METTSKTKKVIAYASGISTILALVFGMWKVDDRYAKVGAIDKAKNEIITEMRREVVKNRSAMIATMEREYDDLGYDISIMETANTPIPRYIEEKRRQLQRDIAQLRQDS